jgi:hypothetical protein
MLSLRQLNTAFMYIIRKSRSNEINLARFALRYAPRSATSPAIAPPTPTTAFDSCYIFIRAVYCSYRQRRYPLNTSSGNTSSYSST